MSDQDYEALLARLPVLLSDPSTQLSATKELCERLSLLDDPHEVSHPAS